jgi:hypothetical protein
MYRTIQPTDWTTIKIMTDQKRNVVFHFLQGRSLFLFSICFSLCHLSYSQIKIYPITKSTTPADQRSSGVVTRTQALSPMSLPFFDDFSTPLKSTGQNLYPATDRWENSFSVWVNPGLGINAPTVNVATFDGLDSAGNAYNSTEIFLNGLTDSLVSRRINLTPTADNPVNASDRGSVFLSFFYQWQGNGEPPDDDDYLQVQFKNSSNVWVTQAVVRADASITSEEFYSTIIAVSGDEYFHENFQFRFRSFGRLSGPYDTWNIDYVYLNKNRSSTDLSFPDRAAASGISPLFFPYSSMPYYHFLASPRISQVTFDVKNLKDFPSSTNYNATVTSKNYVNNALVSSQTQTLVASKGVKGGSGDLENFERVNVVVTDLPNPNDPVLFDPASDSVDLLLKMQVISNDQLDAQRFNFQPFDLQINDTVSETYHLKNFYAYDDGVAEYAAGLIESGNVLAYEFEMPPGLNDTLKVLQGFEIYFPPFGITTNQTVDFLVFQEGDGKPRGEGLLIIPARTPHNNGVNKFQRFRFFPALQIEGNKFFIGWRQPVSGKVLVGLDNSNDTGSKMFYNVEGSVIPKAEHWQQNTVVKGSLMIRPIFTTGEVDITTGIGEEPDFAIYPNPTKGSFYIDGIVDRLDVISSTGQKILVAIQHDNGKTLVDMKSSVSGLYILRYVQGGTVKTQKIIVTK